MEEKLPDTYYAVIDYPKEAALDSSDDDDVPF